MSIVSTEKLLHTIKEVPELIHTNLAYVCSLIKVRLLPALKLGYHENPVRIFHGK